ncbi:RsiV family protein [Luteimonas sp. MJ246]|uniref:RsiV family protein n=1 Tax=Luteimonas sp. MJ174 TaxID=3129237 RepID=UPI0031BA4B1D
MVRRLDRVVPLLLLAALVLAGCRREAEVPGGAAVDAPPTAAARDTGPEQTPLVLEDVMESDPRYIIGISYPPGINRYPGLAAELKRYADAARADLMEAVDARDPDAPSAGAPYDLSLPFDMVMESPEVVAVQAGGTSYTGGAHGTPLVARFVWLPQRRELLRVGALFEGPGAWRGISDFVRESLHGALSQRLDADEALAPEDRARLQRSGGRMIDEGTAPEAGNFDQFEPMEGAGGRLGGLRFVFPPYQVGPYSDGVQTVDVPAAVLLPHVAPQYRDLFAAD